MKIVYVLGSLALKGGAERILSERMSYLADVNGFDVSVITCKQFPEKDPNIYPLSKKVKQINLQIADYKQYKYKYPVRLWIKWKYRQILRKQLQNTINKIDPDIVVGMSYTEADIVCGIKIDASIIIESHEARSYTMESHLQRDASWISRLCYKLYRAYYIYKIEKYADVVISLTESDAKMWHKAQRVEIIPNFSSMTISRYSDGSTKHAIAVGRLSWQKGYERLINIWELVSQKHTDWHLNIYGEGCLEAELKNIINQKNLNNISIHSFTKDISQRYAESSLCLLTSHYEGFSLALLEALRHGVPCITFDCPYGPSDVVDNERCGYVIKDGDIKLFADKVCYLIEHPETWRSFSTAAIEKGACYNKEAIMQQWNSLFSSLIKT